MNFKKSIRKIHLWLGLASGIIVFIVAITGCIYAFQEEILELTETYKKVEKQEHDFVLPTQLKTIGQQQLPNKHIHAIQYRGKEEAAEVIFYNANPLYYDICYVNPYNGEVIRTVNELSGFFRFILDGHFYLWLPEKIGQTVIASATLIFVLLIISGFILWFPKNKKAAKQRFWFRWKNTTKWKRKNYDLHNITGFYVLSIALIFAITGLVWGFPWFAYSYYTVIGGEKSLLYAEPVASISESPLVIENPLDKVWLKMVEEYPNASAIEVHPPETNEAPIAANANVGQGTYWQTDYRYFDPYTLEEKEVEHIYGKLKNATISDKIMRMNYDIHTGAIIGLPGKIFAFLISLLIASLPITGFMIWWGKRNK
ncbi:PepSY domain-containing protein [Flavobacterium sp. J27]|uniref:PepSY-associated TM helix domain-containing protein n=1 Tax=Flavobacterium sp. J27 TaxID=2060419 RepID=UPI0010327885|nr:PepSY-associated TM helix domain-containing protein [Flavobacterium sp. J27]